MLEELIDSLSLANLIERPIKIIVGREHYRSACIVLHVGIITNAISSEGRLAKIENLLRGATAFNREHWTSKYSIAATERISEHGCFVGTL